LGSELLHSMTAPVVVNAAGGGRSAPDEAKGVDVDAA
jgi:hypothetical protein